MANCFPGCHRADMFGRIIVQKHYDVLLILTGTKVVKKVRETMTM